MQRELKFRAWYQNKMHFNITKAHYEHNAMSGREGDLWDFAEWLKYGKVMQYTGLLDKNGVGIYEGDILKYNTNYNESLGGQVCNGISVVSFENGSFMIDKDFADKDWAVEHELIGNIFENSELLKQ